MDQLCGEIDRIATTANFNGHKLLDGSIGGTDSIKLSCVDGEIKYTSPKLDNSALNPTTATGNTNYTVKADTLKPGTYTYKTDHWENSDNETVTVTNGTKPAVGAKVTLNDEDGTTPVTSGGIKVKSNASGDKGKTVTYNGTDWKDADGNTVNVTAEIVGPSNGDKFTVKEGINLQIGESSTSADRLEVSINSFHTDTLFGGLDKFVNTTNDSTDKAATAAVKIKNSNDASTYNKAVSIDITDKDAASAAADAIRQVSNYVSDERGKLGAQQNRLEHTVNNLTTASENTTASKSRILDTDMAKEMMSYTSKNVIAQAAQSMLAQANSQPQNVLSLLQ
ncbi:MAG: hypothetical protein IKN85_04260 [Oscillospiraceae bacterium]|nr:hypothetical protein [Oscillospiraceae bacterium]